MNNNEILEPSQDEEKVASSQESCLEVALQYLRQGWSVIPIGLDDKGAWKKALVPWKKYQSQLPTVDEVKNWWSAYPDARVAIVTGRVSGLLAIDIDPRHGGHESMKGLYLPPTLMTTTGSGGNHLLYRYPSDKEVPNAVGVIPGIDIRGEGGYIVAPPSVHASGNTYEWTTGLDLSSIVDCPKWILDESEERKAPVGSLLGGVSEGSRNEAATRVIGLALRDLPVTDWETKAWNYALAWNGRNTPPLNTKELRDVFDSISKRELEKRETGASSFIGEEQEPDKTQLIRQFVEYSGIRFFRDGTGRSFVKLKEKDHEELWSCNSLEVQRRVELFFYMQIGKPAPTTLVASIVSLLDAKARFEGQRFDPSLRVASGNEGELYYDLADEGRGMIQVTRQGWEKVQNPNVHFIRYQHLAQQVEPDPAGDIRSLLEMVNISDEKQQLLLLCYVVAAFVPDIQHPILVVTGNQGSAKTTVMRMIKQVVDPSPLSTLSFPQNLTELALVLSQNWMPGFDNISDMPPWLSDELCKACTGQCLSKRRLYTDEESIIVSYKRCVLLNGINVPVYKSDLLSRSLLLRTDVIPKAKRKSERKIQAEFKERLPSILGGVFNALSGAMNCLELIPEDDLSRMADFDRWGRAITMALGMSPELFIEAMKENADRQTGEAISRSPIALAVMELIGGSRGLGSFEGNATDLLRQLEVVAFHLKINTKAKDWPKSPAALSMRLNEIECDLIEHGIRLTHTGHLRQILLEKIAEEPDSDAPQSHAPDALNAVSETFNESQSS